MAGVLMLKPYIVLPYAFATGAWIYAARLWSKGAALRVHPLQVVVPIVLVFGAVMLFGRFFPEYSADQMAETVATHQGYWRQTEGGSAVNLGSAEARTFAGQIPFLFIGLFNALFRPVVFEVHNAPAAAAALETGGIAIVAVTILARSGWTRIVRTVMVSPPLVFSFVFFFCFAMLVGVLSANLGSLSRYRVPMMPFYVGALLLLRKRLRAPVRDARLAAIAPRRRSVGVASRLKKS
jgi:hypothetical protein